MDNSVLHTSSMKYGYRRSIALFPRKDKIRIAQISFFQLTLGLLDLIGISLIGVLGALSVNGIQSRTSGSRVNVALDFFGLSNLTFQWQVGILGCMAVTILISRTAISVIFSRKILFYLSRKGAQLTSDLTAKVLSQSVSDIERIPKQHLIYDLTAGVNSIALGVIGTSVTLLSDISLVVVMSIGLFIVDPILASVLLLFFGLIIVFLYLILHKRALRLGIRESSLVIQGNNQMHETFNSFREILVSNRRGYYLENISRTRQELSETTADLAFMPNISKYVVESAIILGGLAMSAIQFMLQDASHAIATLTIFLAGGSRIAPAMMRLQQGAVTIKGSLGAGESTLRLSEKISKTTKSFDSFSPLDFEHVDFSPEIEFRNVSFSYVPDGVWTLDSINFSAKPGDLIAIVGPSGAGKSTLADLLIGALSPSSGEVLVSNLPPKSAIQKWPGAISYVPQDVYIYSGSLRENIALGLPSDLIQESQIDAAIHKAQIESFVASVPEGKNLDMGGNGTRLSGGQKQRIGIARALYTNPRVLILDEATSSLDSQLEADITNNLAEMKGACTMVVIAHRLSTVRNADKVLYVDNGKILASGTFDQVRQQIPNFDAQARLLGL